MMRKTASRSSCIIMANTSRRIVRRSQSSTATAVAVRRAPLSRESSPKKSPAWRTASSRSWPSPVIVSRTRPRAMTNISSPGSYWRKIIVPAGTRRSSVRSAQGCRPRRLLGSPQRRCRGGPSRVKRGRQPGVIDVSLSRTPVLRGACVTAARVLSVLALTALAFGAPGAETAREILERRKALENGTRWWDDRHQQLTMRIAGRGADRTREVDVYDRRYPDGERKTTVFVQAPADMKGTAFLSFTHKGRPAEQWLYLPELERVRQITASA